MQHVLGQPSYREAAGRIAAAIAEEIAPDRAVEEIEAVLTSTTSPEPVTA